MRARWRRAFERHHGLDLERPARVRLPGFHVGCVDACGVRYAIRAFYDRGQQHVIFVLTEASLVSPALETLARSIDSSGVLRREVHPASTGTTSGWRKVSTDEALRGGKLGELRRYSVVRRINRISNYVRALKNVRRHEQITRANAPPLRFERPANACSSGEGVVH